VGEHTAGAAVKSTVLHVRGARIVVVFRDELEADEFMLAVSRKDADPIPVVAAGLGGRCIDIRPASVDAVEW
jgi:hypothetical protein